MEFKILVHQQNSRSLVTGKARIFAALMAIIIILKEQVISIRKKLNDTTMTDRVTSLIKYCLHRCK